MKKKTILALIMGGSMILTACGKSVAVSEAVENSSIQQSIEDSGEQNEEVYDHTNNAEIALAFREAGEISGS
ncbi:hypothetical protein [Butyrivibrio sp. YAB3001]|uniref:hypothetical protein n=1 Tax=Butyrivibrio sp. YAB3001 TaxID=1520812 RepID=UPI0008F655C3|nr:hypothetical protein [Butyrivibrio sp. YAB3001]SFC01818.1 hypothetical protein SAMN02910398_01330 [Butyrivibrio sp. YAB3001]